MQRLKSWTLFFLLLTLIWGVGTAVAQDNNQLTLNLSRDFGTGLGSNIQGRFSFRVEGPDTLTRVSFYIDDQLVGEDSEAPFRLQFETDDYPLGNHTLYAIGFTADGQELQSNRITQNFISGSSANRTVLLIVVPILVLSIGGTLLAAWFTSRGNKGGNPANIKVHGPFGGTICPKCHKPFARHIWGLNLVVGKYDRCPHCGKWSLVRAMPPAVLDAAVEAMEAEAQQNQPKPAADNAETWRKRLDDSKFDS
ncbi:MAG: Ig-like domain-containing protein [Candidatus Promineifilaceae bacterium]